MNKIIHQIFLDIGLTPLSERKDYVYNIEIIKRNNPDWKHILWNDKMVNDFVKKFYPEYLSIWNNFPNKFYKIDYVRYLILNTHLSRIGIMQGLTCLQSVKIINTLQL